MNVNFARLLIGGLLAAASLGAQAQNYSFNCITNNNAADCATGVAQFRMEVTVNESDGIVDLRFSNLGPNPSSITDIYFDWNTSALALPQGTLSDSGAGVAFSWGAHPRNLPGGNPIGFSSNLSADSDSPVQPMGVNPGEWLNVSFNTSVDVIGGLNSGGLRVGIHAQGYQGGGSESLTTVTTPIPEPQTYAMLLAGLGLVLLARRRKERPALA